MKWELFNHIIAKNFFTNYCTDIARWPHKLRGLDSNNKEIDFTEEDRKKIKAGVNQLCKDLKEMV